MKRRILIVKLSSLGDLLQAFPVARHLKLQEECSIDWVVESEYADVVAAHPDVDSVIPVNMRALKKGKGIKAVWSVLKKLMYTPYDVVFDLQGNTKSALFTLVARGLDKVGFSFRHVSEWPAYFVTYTRVKLEKDLSMQERYLALVGAKAKSDYQIPLKCEDAPVVKNGYILVCPGSRWSNKQLSKAQWESFLGEIRVELNASFYFVYGSQEERNLCNELQGESDEVLGKMSIPEIQSVMRKCDQVICVDSALLHLAALTNVPTFAIFGASSAKVYNPKGKKHIAVSGECPYNIKFDKRCPHLRRCTTGLCIKGLKTWHIMQAYRASCQSRHVPLLDQSLL